MAMLPGESPQDRGRQRTPTATGVVLRRALAGEGASQSKLFTRLRRVLLRDAQAHPLSRRVKSRFAAEDVVAEVWLRCFTSGVLERFEDHGPGSLRGLLRTILDRTLHDMARRMNSAKRAEPAAASPAEGGPRSIDRAVVEPSRDPTPSSDARAAELRTLVEAILDDREREIWRWSHEEELDSSEIAARLGTTSETVRGVLFRARRKLAARLSTLDGPGDPSCC